MDFTDFAAIPLELQQRNQWCLWRRVMRGGRPTKMPFRPSGEPARSNDPATWCSFDDAIFALMSGEFAGLGIMLGQGLFGIDLDGVRDPRTGTVTAEASSIIRRLSSYTEVSPSGKGIHILFEGDRLPDGRRRNGFVELYGPGSPRFLTVTCQHLAGTPETLEHRQAEMEAVHGEYLGGQRSAGGQEPLPLNTASGSGSRPLSLGEASGSGAPGWGAVPRQGLLTPSGGGVGAPLAAPPNSGPLARLLAGDWSGYASRSEADLALCSFLAARHGGDAAQVDAQFRKSGLMRPKWDEPRGELTYGQRTVARAVGGTIDHAAATGNPTTHPVPAGVLARHSNGHVNGAGQEPRGHEHPTHVNGAFPHTDVGNAKRLVARHGHDLRFCHLWGKWLVWDGTRWASDTRGDVMARAKDTIAALRTEAESLDGREREALRRFAIASERLPRLQAMVQLAQCEPGIPVEPEQLDADPWLLNCENGTLDLRTGTLRPHAREDLLTRLAPVRYDPSADVSAWEAFLARVAPEAPVREFLQRWFGYCLTGVTREDKLVMAYGTGANGKTVLMEAVAGVLGDYAQTTPTETLLEASRAGGASGDVARLRGARMVQCNEFPEGGRLAENKLKQLTGGDTVVARFLYGEHFEFRPTHKLMVRTNHKPSIRGADWGIWRRVALVPFTVTVSEADRRPRDELLSELQGHASGILRWMVEGCLLWQREGLQEPAAVRAATDEYRVESDMVGSFLAERTRPALAESIAARELYEAFTAWCEDTGEKACSQRTFGVRLSERGLVRGRSNTGSRTWEGVALTG